MSARERLHTTVALSNPRDPALNPLRVTALVDTGAMTQCIPRHVAVQLDLSELEKREVTKAEGRHVSVPYVGPVQVRFANRSCFTGALVLGDGVLLGSNASAVVKALGPIHRVTQDARI